MHNMFHQGPHWKKHLHEVNYMYRYLVEHSPDAIVLHHNDEFIYVNPAALELFGAKSTAELFSHSLFEFIPDNKQHIVSEAVRKLQNKGREVAPISLQLLKLDGTKMDVEVTATSVTYGGRQIIQGMLREVTEKKSVQELQSLNQEWKIFRQLVRHLADQTLNPLAVIRGFLELLNEGSDVSVDLLLQEAAAIDEAWNRLIELSHRDSSQTQGSPLSFFDDE